MPKKKKKTKVKKPTRLSTVNGHNHLVRPGNNRSTMEDGHTHAVVWKDGKVVEVLPADGHTHRVLKL